MLSPKLLSLSALITLALGAPHLIPTPTQPHALENRQGTPVTFSGICHTAPAGDITIPHGVCTATAVSPPTETFWIGFGFGCGTGGIDTQRPTNCTSDGSVGRILLFHTSY